MSENEQIRNVLNEHPDLPVMLITPSVRGDYDAYYHQGIEASVEGILMPHVVERTLGCECGLSEEKYYTDEGKACEDVAEWLFETWWDCAMQHGLGFHYPTDMDEVLTTFCGYVYDYAGDVSIDRMAELVARELVDSMPWRDYVIIRASL